MLMRCVLYICLYAFQFVYFAFVLLFMDVSISIVNLLGDGLRKVHLLLRLYVGRGG